MGKVKCVLTKHPDTTFLCLSNNCCDIINHLATHVTYSFQTRDKRIDGNGLPTQQFGFFFSVCLSLLRKTDVKVLEVQGVIKSKRLVDPSLSDSTLTVPLPGTISAGRCLTA